MTSKSKLVPQRITGSTARNQMLTGFRFDKNDLFVSSTWRPGESFPKNEIPGSQLTKDSVKSRPREMDAARMNSAQRIIAKCGGQTGLAKLIGRRQSTVQYWAKRGSIPGKWQQKILDVAVELGVSVSPAEFAIVGENAAIFEQAARTTRLVTEPRHPLQVPGRPRRRDAVVSVELRGNHIKERLRELALTQERAAEACGISYRHFNRITLSRSDPSLSIVVRLETVLDAPYAELFDLDIKTRAAST